MSFALLIFFPIPTWLSSGLFVVLQTLPQACIQGIEGPLGSSASAGPWTCLIPACFPSNLWPLANGNYCPLPTLLDCDLFPGSMAQPTGLLLATMPLVWGAALLAVPWCLEWHVWICPSGGFLEISLFCVSKHVQRIPKYCKVFRSLVWMLKFRLRNSHIPLQEGQWEGSLCAIMEDMAAGHLFIYLFFLFRLDMFWVAHQTSTTMLVLINV